MKTYMDLMRGEGTMELAVGGVDHLDHISNTLTSRLSNIETDIAFLSIFGQTTAGASGQFLTHDECFLDCSNTTICAETLDECYMPLGSRMGVMAAEPEK